MEKPLHERLREHTDDELHFVCEGSMLVSISRKGAQRIADEIERDYVTKEQHEAEITRIVEAQENGAHHVIKTWAEHNGMPMRKNETITEWIERLFYALPCDKNGEPWRLGDGCVTAEGEDGTVVGYRANGMVFVSLNDERCFARFYASDIKRHAAKVLDADGEEIKVGDTVWFANSGTERTVKSLRQHDDGGYEIEFTNGLYCTSPYQLTHERPVFDEDGERIRKGDTVWYIKTGRELKVLSPHGYGECTYDCVDCFGFYPKPSELTHERPVFDAEGVRIRKGDEGWSNLSGKKLAPVVGCTEDKFGMKVDLEDGYWIEPINFTHREPDSLEKLRYDILREDRTRGMSCVHAWADRLTAIMERGA